MSVCYQCELLSCHRLLLSVLLIIHTIMQFTSQKYQSLCGALSLVFTHLSRFRRDVCIVIIAVINRRTRTLNVKAINRFIALRAHQPHSEHCQRVCLSCEPTKTVPTPTKRLTLIHSKEIGCRVLLSSNNLAWEFNMLT